MSSEPLLREAAGSTTALVTAVPIQGPAADAALIEPAGDRPDGRSGRKRKIHPGSDGDSEGGSARKSRCKCEVGARDDDCPHN